MVKCKSISQGIFTGLGAKESRIRFFKELNGLSYQLINFMAYVVGVCVCLCICAHVCVKYLSVCTHESSVCLHKHIFGYKCVCIHEHTKLHTSLILIVIEHTVLKVGHQISNYQLPNFPKAKKKLVAKSCGNNKSTNASSLKISDE